MSNQPYPTQIRLDYTPRKWQRELHRDLRRFSVVAASRRSGKTETAIMLLIDSAMKSDEQLPFYAYVAPYLTQSKTVAWARLKEKVEPLRRVSAVEIREGELSVRFPHNGAVIRLFGADRPEALRGIRLDGCVIDEVAHIRPEVWTDVLQPALSDRKGFALFIGTPNGINLFSELFYHAQELDEWHAARFSIYETNALDDAEIARLRRDMPENAFAREYLCSFEASADDQLISLTDVEVASRRTYAPADVAGAPRILGVDPARFGSDRSVIVKRQGLHVLKPIVLRECDNMQLAARVAQEIQDWRPDAVFIDAGAGAGVIDRLRQLHFVVVEVPFGGKAIKPELFVNRRTEMWAAMSEWLANGGSIPNDSSLKAELATPTYSFDVHGKKKLESKDDIKKRLLGNSPDMANALALTFAAPVTPVSEVDRAIEQFERKRQRSRQEACNNYDPYAEFECTGHDPFAAL